MRYIICLLLIGMIACESGRAHESSRVKPAPVEEQIKEVFYEKHEKYLEKAITKRRFKHDEIVALVEKQQNNKQFEVTKIGRSVENRDIFLIKAGSGQTKVLLWSQMHGDEPTATMALFDIFNYLGDENNQDPEKAAILKNTTLYFIPMLNPDGAQQYKRRNALDIDLNRDAVRLQSPESRVLKAVRDSLNPDFGFNLHDQSTRYSAGKSDKPATISFLAPPYDEAKSVNEVRENAMKLIIHLNKRLQLYIPGQVAKYSDEHEPRAFGDNIQKWGTSVVLIESGGYKDDPEKQYIRKLNYMVILSALQSIAEKSYAKEVTTDYFDIPENERYIYDLIVRNGQVKKDNEFYKTDIGINRYETNVAPYTDFYYRSSIDEMGDMSVVHGYEELNAENMRLIPGKVYPKAVKNLKTLKKMDIKALLSQGFTSVRVITYPSNEYFTNLPINIIAGKRLPNNEIALGRNPNFVLEQDGQIRYAIVNGFIYDLAGDSSTVANALVN